MNQQRMLEKSFEYLTNARKIIDNLGSKTTPDDYGYMINHMVLAHSWLSQLYELYFNNCLGNAKIMNYKNLKNKYVIKIVAAPITSDGLADNAYFDLFECPIDDFGHTLMRVIKDRVAERLIVLNDSFESER